MERHEELRLREKELFPTQEVLKKTLGKSYGAYAEFQDGLAGLELEQEWTWFPSHKVWAAKGVYYWTSPRGTKKEKAIYWLHVFDGYFCVAVWFKEKNRVVAQECGVSDEAKKMIGKSETWGKVPTFPAEFEVHSREHFDDICALIRCKKEVERN